MPIILLYSYRKVKYKGSALYAGLEKGYRVCESPLREERE